MGILTTVISLIVYAQITPSKELRMSLIGKSAAMQLARFVGRCEIIKRLVIFEDSSGTSIDGDLLVAFLNDQAKKAGIDSNEQYFKACVDSQSTYQELIKYYKKDKGPKIVTGPEEIKELNRLLDEQNKFLEEQNNLQ